MPQVAQVVQSFSANSVVAGDSSVVLEQAPIVQLGNLMSSVATKTRILLDQGSSRLADLSSEVRRRSLRSERAAGTRRAGELLPEGNSVFRCGRFVVSGEASVVLEGVKNEQGAVRAFYKNIERCGSVWGCPSCAAYIASRRAGELRLAVDCHLEKGGSVALLTLTTRHTRMHRLVELLSAFRLSQRSFKQTRAWKGLNAGMLGSVTATEVTFSPRNGWHPHVHMLLFLEGGVVPDVEKLTEAWLSALRKYGLDGVEGVALDLQGGGAAASYLAKWGLDKELARGDAKHGGGSGFAPFELLRASSLSGLSVEEQNYYAGLFLEYYRAFKGRRQLTWSRGLKAVFGIGEVEDEEIAVEGNELEKADITVFSLRIPFGVWVALVVLKADVALLELVESERFDDAIAFFSRLSEYVEENRVRGLRYNWAGRLVPIKKSNSFD